MNWRELQPHALNVYPAMDDKEYEELKQSLEKGFDHRMPIMVFENGIIDGVNRHRACIELGIIPLVKEFYGTTEEARDFILKTNVRRNLTAGQRAAVVLDMDSVVNRLVEEAASRRDSFSSLPASGQTDRSDVVLGKMAGVGKQTMFEAKKIKQFDPQLFEHVKAGNISAKSAYNQIKDRINAGDEERSQQIRAKNALKQALKEGFQEVEEELYFEALERVKNNTIQNFKLQITSI